MTAIAGIPLQRLPHPRQLIKWTVYTLLLANGVYYAWDEWSMAQHTLRAGGSVLQWASAFATTLDELAWFGLLFLWELETWWLPYGWFTPWRKRAFLAGRVICYAFIAHTVVARAMDFDMLRGIEALPGVDDACELAGQGLSYARNLDYTLIEARNCAALPVDTPYFPVESTAVTDTEGLRLERFSRWIDLQDAVAWLLVMLTIEIAIWLQEHEITGGPLMLASHTGKALYALLFAHAAYWAYYGHWVYAWDQVLWIVGFFAIELNVRDWRIELDEEEELDTPGRLA